jgi:hypothetical protein
LRGVSAEHAPRPTPVTPTDSSPHRRAITTTTVNSPPTHRPRPGRTPTARSLRLAEDDPEAAADALGRILSRSTNELPSPAVDDTRVLSPDCPIRGHPHPRNTAYFSTVRVEPPWSSALRTAGRRAADPRRRGEALRRQSPYVARGGVMARLPLREVVRRNQECPAQRSCSSTRLRVRESRTRADVAIAVELGRHAYAEVGVGATSGRCSVSSLVVCGSGLVRCSRS